MSTKLLKIQPPNNHRVKSALAASQFRKRKTHAESKPTNHDQSPTKNELFLSKKNWWRKKHRRHHKDDHQNLGVQKETSLPLQGSTDLVEFISVLDWGLVLIITVIFFNWMVQAGTLSGLTSRFCALQKSDSAVQDGNKDGGKV